ncbi:MAG: hypothetical protein EAZ60_08515 [Oscillatoriales cyanobacterium]|nr:MAG: hypothetical protein EAZ83_14250 [Oscillatoriales cyanobacterium]TAF19196.1 MAG: hypothetical protein EAZ73_16060 [Oscillatoriales cyanobacterium]TAF27622.1 MAG: hypothetical protein EAZ69_27715 [Oscillatoriales cyanobacterium]TAF56833.1 MAG: hypothetical protein EAZ60_08515 [Oscillatoriales cyanobacterium]
MILPISIAFWNQRPAINQDLDRWRRGESKRDSFLKLETRLWMHREPALIDASSFGEYFDKKTKFIQDFLPDNN